MTVDTIERQKLLVAADFGDSSLPDDQNGVCMPDRGKAMGYGKHGTVFHGFVQCILNHPFCDGVKGTGCLIKDQDGGIFQNGAGDDDTLFFTA